MDVFVRLEAIRTEKPQTRYQPLQPYMATKMLVKYSRLWQQILIFIARTQAAHDWASPAYELTAGQERTWQTLVHEAEKVMTEQIPSSGEGKNEDGDDGKNGNRRRDGSENGIEKSLTNVSTVLSRAPATAHYAERVRQRTHMRAGRSRRQRGRLAGAGRISFHFISYDQGEPVLGDAAGVRIRGLRRPG
jgi:hypothetical protein